MLLDCNVPGVAMFNILIYYNVLGIVMFRDCNALGIDMSEVAMFRDCSAQGL
jgi:hypothetical protein